MDDAPRDATTSRGSPGTRDARARTDPLATALAWLAEGRRVALATVVETWGSAPRRPGSHMVVDHEGAFAGSVSGGCVEVAVADEARRALADGRFRDLSYGVADDEAWAVGLACGGTVRVLVVPVRDGRGAVAPALLRAAVEARRGGAPCVLVFDPADGTVVGADERPDLDEEVLRPLRTSGRSALVEAGGPDARPLFARPYTRPVRLVLVGAVHIAQPLAAMARVLRMQVVVVDPREAFARPDRFAGVEPIVAWPDEALARVGLDARTAVVALTHDPKIDDPALRAALQGPVFYVGALGSRRTHARRRARLAEAGVDPGALDRIHAPVGLDLGGRAPEEIAVAILAEIVAELRGGSAVRGR